jgi:hypothetical protein
MDEPKVQITCKHCGKPIRLIGPYWMHVNYTPRHVAQPDMSFLDDDAPFGGWQPNDADTITEYPKGKAKDE